MATETFHDVQTDIEQLKDALKKRDAEINQLKKQIAGDATPQMIEITREWFMKSNSNPLDFVRWTEANPVIMLQKVLEESDEYYQKQKDYNEIIGELGVMIENIDQNACDVFNKLTEKYRNEIDAAEQLKPSNAIE